MVTIDYRSVRPYLERSLLPGFSDSMSSWLDSLPYLSSLDWIKELSRVQRL